MSWCFKTKKYIIKEKCMRQGEFKQGINKGNFKADELRKIPR